MPRIEVHAAWFDAEGKGQTESVGFVQTTAEGFAEMQRRGMDPISRLLEKAVEIERGKDTTGQLAYKRKQDRQSEDPDEERRDPDLYVTCDDCGDVVLVVEAMRDDLGYVCRKHAFPGTQQ